MLSVAKRRQNTQFMTDELEAIVQTAKDYGMTVAVHAHGKEGMRRAILAGIDSIEHGTYMDNEIIKLMRKHDVYYVPTILAGNFVAEKAKIDGYFPDIVRPKAAAIGPLIQKTFARAHETPEHHVCRLLLEKNKVSCSHTINQHTTNPITLHIR